MSVAFVRSTENRVSTGSVSSMTLSISASSGQFVAVFGFPSGGSSSVPVSSITDSGSNTWAIPGNYGSTNPPAEYTGGSGCFIGYSNIGTALTSVTVNIPTANELTVCVAVFSGVKTAFPFDQGAVGTGTSTPTLSSLAGDLVLGIANTSNATSISGMSTLTTDHGNLAGYGIPGGNENVTMGWSPSQSAPAGIAEFLVGATTVNGTASFTDSESFTGNATIAPIASFTESEAFTAISGANPHVSFSAVVPSQNDPNGIPLQFGLTAYNYTSPTATTYDHWISLQNGQLASGTYNTTEDLNLYRKSSGNWATDNNLAVGQNLRVGTTTALGDNGNIRIQLANATTVPTTNPTGGGILYSNQATPTWRDTGGNLLGMVRAYSARASADLTLTTSQVAITGATVNVVVTGSNATAIVTVNWDCQTTTTSTTTIVGQLVWNGTAETPQGIFISTGTSGSRATIGQSYVITGITAGTYTADLTAAAPGGSGETRQTHTGFSLILIDQ